MQSSLCEDTSFSRCLFLTANSTARQSQSNLHNTSPKVGRRRIDGI
nr:MAG TPA: hypothetical protein [Caudoviricetes sp.]